MVRPRATNGPAGTVTAGQSGPCGGTGRANPAAPTNARQITHGRAAAPVSNSDRRAHQRRGGGAVIGVDSRGNAGEDTEG